MADEAVGLCGDYRSPGPYQTSMAAISVGLMAVWASFRPALELVGAGRAPRAGAAAGSIGELPVALRWSWTEATVGPQTGLEQEDVSRRCMGNEPSAACSVEGRTAGRGHTNSSEGSRDGWREAGGCAVACCFPFTLLRSLLNNLCGEPTSHLSPSILAHYWFDFAFLRCACTPSIALGVTALDLVLAHCYETLPSSPLRGHCLRSSPHASCSRPRSWPPCTS